MSSCLLSGFFSDVRADAQELLMLALIPNTVFCVLVYTFSKALIFVILKTYHSALVTKEDLQV